MRNKLVFGIIIIQLVVIFAIVAPQEYKMFNYNATVKLKTVPVDPVDLMRGHYAVVRYEISAIKATNGIEVQKIKEGNTIYVGLKIVNGFAKAEDVYSQPPIGKIFIKGTLTQIAAATDEDYKQMDKTGEYWDYKFFVRYNIEKIFISEAKAKKMVFSNNPNNPYQVTVKIGRYGDAQAISIDPIKKKPRR